MATSNPNKFEHLRVSMGKTQLSLLTAIADANQIRAAITRLYFYQLAQKAITQVPNRESCRDWGTSKLLKSKWALVLSVSAITGIVMFPLLALTLLVLWAALTVTLTGGIKGAGFIAQILHKTPEKSAPITLNTPQFCLPRVSVMVPLLHEQEIAGALIKRLEKLTYPKSLLDIVLVLEATDEVTSTTLARTNLPNWIRVVEVPNANGLTTKPRALNYAIDFCRGSIVGVWDTEDAPEPDQLEKVVMRFNEAPKNVVYLQEILDYYNPCEN